MANAWTVEAGKAVWDGRRLVDWLADVVAELVRTFDPAEVWLHGSVARGSNDGDRISICPAARCGQRFARPRAPGSPPSDSGVDGRSYGDAVSERDVGAVQAFNEAINSRDLDQLSGLMSADHRFIDAAGGMVAGRDACVEAWDSFFESFPDYRNVFESVAIISPGRVQIDGFSSCTFEPLDGPARWYATVTQGLISEWRVEDRPDHS